MKRIVYLLFLLPVFANAQEDLLKELEGGTKEKQISTAAFKGSRLVNGHTVETRGKGELEFIFQHRFGLINSGAYNMFGLDQAFVRLGLDYGITNNLSASISRNSVDKTMDGFLKYKIARQSTGSGSFPLTITAFGGLAYKTSPRHKDNPGISSSDRMAYVGQLLIAHKFSTALSLQLMPTFIHKNLISQPGEKNDVMALGFGGRWKVSRSMALTTEYYPRLNAPDNAMLAEKRYDSVGFGIEIETGGHIFQLVMTNTQSLTERAFITETTGDISNGDFHFGFNVTRGFQIGKRK